MKNKLKQKSLKYFFSNNRKEKNKLKKNNYSKFKNKLNKNNKNNSSNSGSSYEKRINLNKFYIESVKKIKQKAKYFDSYNKKKQNKDLIEIKNISDKLKKSLKILEKKKQNFKSFNNTKLLNLFVNVLKIFNKNLFSSLKNNGLYSIFTKKNKTQCLEPKIKKEIQISTKTKNLKKLNIFKPNTNLNLIKFLNNKEDLDKKIKNSNLKKIIFIKKNFNINFINKINTLIVPLTEKRFIPENKLINLFKLANQQQKNYENVNILNEKNKIQTAIIIWAKNSYYDLYKKTIEQIDIYKNFIPLTKKNIRKYIRSKNSFSPKFVKLLNTSNNYNFNKFNQINNPIRENIYEFLQKSFISFSTLISKPVYINTPDKIIIQFFYLLINKKINKLNKIINNNYLNNKNNNKSILILENNNKLKFICNILTRFFKKTVELELIRLYYPYYNSKILVNLFSIYINKIKLRKIVKKFIHKAVKTKSSKFVRINKKMLPSEISGIKFKVAGRLMTQRVVPRKTVKFINRGALSRAKTMFVESARFTNKNKRGAFSITISIAHKLKSPLIN
jgi:hypothetical protein